MDNSTLPMISVVIPTRNRAGTLKYCLDTILSQSYPNMQVVVSDNNSTDNTSEVVAKFNDPRIVYVRSDISLTMNENYNFALDAASGDFVTYIGDDDGFLPDAISFAMEILKDGKYSALTWRKLNYTWPDHKMENSRNLFIGQSEPVIFPVDGKRKLQLLANFREAYNNLPCIYNSIVAMDKIQCVRSKSSDGLFFGGIIPDVYSGIALSLFVGKYLQALFPLTVNGASGMSGGVLQGLKTRNKQEEELIKDITPESLKRNYHPDIGTSSSIASITLGEFLCARNKIAYNNWPKPNWRSYVKAMIREARTSVNQNAILESAQHTVKCKKLFLRVPKIHSENKLANPVRTGAFQGQLVLPPQLVSNVYDASMLASSLLPSVQSIENSAALYIIKKWMRFSLLMLVDLYRCFFGRQRA